MFEITLPIPSSVNRMYRGISKNHKGFHKKEKYKAWEKEALQILSTVITPHYTENAEYLYLFYPKNKTFGDPENYCKPITDALVKSGVLKDDKHTILTSGKWDFIAYDKDNPRVEVKVWQK